MNMTNGLTALLWFGVILALIPLSLWLLKRTPMGGAGSGPIGAPRPVAQLPLSTQHRLVTVEVGQGDERLWLVLGISPQGIRTLHTMAPQALLSETPPAPPAAAFAQLLSRLRGNGGGGEAQ